MYINMLYLGTIEIITYNLSDNHFTGSIINLLFTKNIDKGVFSINRARFNHFLRLKNDEGLYIVQFNKIGTFTISGCECVFDSTLSNNEIAYKFSSKERIN